MKKILIFVFALSIFLPFLVSASFETNLKYGSKGSAVIELQNFLQKEGLLKGKIDGKFGTGTRKAVTSFQLANGLKGSGIFDLGSRNKAKAILADESIVPTITPPSNVPTSPITNVVTTNVPLTGTLDLTQDTTYVSQTVMSPQTNLKLAQFSLKNNTSEVVNINKIETDIAIDSNLSVSTGCVKNLYVVFDNNKTIKLGVLSYWNYLPVNFKLAAGQTIALSVYGDVNLTIPLGSVVNTSILVSGVSVASATNVYTNSNAVLSGQNITFNTGSLNISASSSSPTARTVLSGQLVDAGEFQFTGTADSYTISQLKFIIPGLNNSSPISNVILQDTATKTTIATAQVKNDASQSNFIFDFFPNISIPINSPKSLTVYYDISKNINSNSTDINIAPVLIYVKAINSAGLIIDGAAGNYSDAIAAHGGISIPSSGVVVNSLLMFKSIPTITSIPVDNISTKNGSDLNLYKFSIKADPNGDVSIKQLTFTISFSDPNISNPYLSNFEFFKGDINYTGSVAIGNIINNNFVGLVSTNGIGAGFTNTVAVNFVSEEVIPAGKVQTYTLRAYVNGLGSSSSISTSLSSDGNLINGGSYLKTEFSKFYDGLFKSDAVPLVINYYNLLWSDMSESSPSPHNNFNGNYTNDWYNGYGILNLPLSANTITAMQ